MGGIVGGRLGGGRLDAYDVYTRVHTPARVRVYAYARAGVRAAAAQKLREKVRISFMRVGMERMNWAKGAPCGYALLTISRKRV